MTALCPNCGVAMDTAGHKPGAVVRCSCQALLVITDNGSLALAPADRPIPRPSLWLQSEQVRERLAAELEELQPYQLEALAGLYRRMNELCRGELHRRGDATSRLRRDP
jgi:DNA mismatch repair protein MutH